MKRSIGCMLVFFLLGLAANGQKTGPKNYRNFPIVFTVQFHSLSYPLKDLKSNFRNVGFGLGSEIALGSGHAWAQQFQVSWYRNQQAGNGILLYTQSAWRPTIVAHMYTELKAGFGYLYSFRPVESFKEVNGNWVSAGHKGKWLFTVPVGFSVGYNNYSTSTYVAPFASYQVLVSANYNKSVPIVTNSLFQLGARIHLPNNKTK